MKSMKRILSFLIATVIMISGTSTAAFAQETEHNITMSELNDLAEKYNIETSIVDKSVPEELIYKNITKEELENIIKGALEEISKSKTINNTIVIDPKSLIDSSNITDNTNLNSLNDTMSTSSIISDQWIVINRSKEFSTYDSSVSPYLQLRRYITGDYQYEMMYDSTTGLTHYRNYKFTGARNAGVVHLNPDPYKLTGVGSSMAIYCYDTVTDNYNIEYEMAVYAMISGMVIRVPLGKNSIWGNDYYYISSVQ